MSDWKTIGGYANRLDYRVDGSRYVTSASTDLPTFGTVSEFLAAIDAALPLYVGDVKIEVGDYEISLTGERLCTNAEMERIQKALASAAVSAKRARERKREAELKTLDRLQKKYPGRTSQGKELGKTE